MFCSNGFISNQQQNITLILQYSTLIGSMHSKAAACDLQLPVNHSILCATLIFSADQQEKAHSIAKHVYVSVQPLSHSRPLLGQLVHVNFLTPPPWRVLGRLMCVAEAVRYYVCHTHFQCRPARKSSL